MTSAEKGIIRPLDQGPAEKDQGNSLGPSLQDPTQKIPGAQPPRTVESGPQLPTLKSQKPPAYQPYQEGDPVLAIEHASLGTKESDVEYVGAATSDFDSDSDTEQLQPAAGETWGENSPAAVERWADSGPGSDIVRQSSDEFEDEDEMDEELGEEDDEGDDGGVYEEDDEDDLSDYTGMEEMEDMSAQGTAEYHRALQHGPYLKSRQQVEQLRKRRPGPLRNRPPRLRTVSGSGAALRLDTGAGSSAYNHPIQANVGFSTQNAFTQSCDELTARLLQGENERTGQKKNIWKKKNRSYLPCPTPYPAMIDLQRTRRLTQISKTSLKSLSNGGRRAIPLLMSRSPLKNFRAWSMRTLEIGPKSSLTEGKPSRDSRIGICKLALSM